MPRKETERERERESLEIHDGYMYMHLYVDTVVQYDIIRSAINNKDL